MSVATPVAQASFPGRNGNLALALELEQCNSQIAIIRADGSDRKWLTAAPCREEGRTESATEPAWSPDGRELLFHASSDVFGSGVGRLAIVSADSSARSEIPLNLEPLKVPRSVDPDGVAADLASSPSFSPDGSHVVYTRRVRSGEEIWRAKLDGSDHRRLAIGSGPHWSPRGERIAYDRPGIWLMRARDGEPIRRLTTRGWIEDWSPDGRRLLFAKPGRETEDYAIPPELYSMRSNGRGTRRLTFGRSLEETDAVWSPDGRRIAFATTTPYFDGEKERCSVWTANSTSGGKLRRIYRSPGAWREFGGCLIRGLAWQPRTNVTRVGVRR